MVIRELGALKAAMAQPQEAQGGASRAATGDLVELLTGQATRTAVDRAKPVDLHMDSKLKARVWASEAIDFRSLTKGHKGPKYVPKVVSGETGPQWTFEVASQSDRPLSAEVWAEAWNIFLAIYVQRHPQAIGGLTLHYQKVQELMTLGGDWASYD